MGVPGGAEVRMMNRKQTFNDRAYEADVARQGKQWHFRLVLENTERNF